MVEGWWSTYQQDEVLTLDQVYHQDPEYYIKKFRMDLQEAVFDKEVFREELRTQKLKVAKLGKQNLEITETRQGTEGQ